MPGNMFHISKSPDLKKIKIFKKNTLIYIKSVKVYPKSARFPEDMQCPCRDKSGQREEQQRLSHQAALLLMPDPAQRAYQNFTGCSP